jgi:hypothetical protein
VRQRRSEWADRVVRDYPDKTDAEKGAFLVAVWLTLIVAMALRGIVFVLALRALLRARRHREQGLATAARAAASPALGCAVAATVADKFFAYRIAQPLARWIHAKLKPHAQE